MERSLRKHNEKVFFLTRIVLPLFN